MKLSIILPVYNVEQYIDDCINSLLHQDIDKDLYEIIFVNDGSTDNSVARILEYKKINSNIRVINQENSGVSKARNTGLDNACGEYIWFIDPDDFIESNCFKFIIDSLEEYEADILEISYRACDENAIFKPKVNEFKVDILNKYGAGASGWIYITKLSFLEKNNIRWNEDLSYGEDYLFAFKLKANENKNIYTKSVIYNYRQRSNSAMNSKSHEKIKKHLNDMIKLAQIYNDELKINYSNDIKSNLEQRKGLCIQAALIDIILNELDEKYINDTINKIEELGLYPYKPLYFNLKINGGIKKIIFSYASFLLNKRWYFNILLFLRRSVYKLRKV